MHCGRQFQKVKVNINIKYLVRKICFGLYQLLHFRYQEIPESFQQRGKYQST